MFSGILEQLRQNSGSEIQDLKKQLKAAKMEASEVYVVMCGLEYKNLSLSDDLKEQVDGKIQLSTEIENTNDLLRSANASIKESKDEIELLKIAAIQRCRYIDSMKVINNQLKTKVINLNYMAKKYDFPEEMIDSAISSFSE